MPTVGDIIFAVRSKIPDMPGTLDAPVTVSVTPQSNAGGLLAAGTLFVKFCYLSSWGVSLPSPEQTFSFTGKNSLLVTMEDDTATASGMPPGAIGFRVYIGTVAGGENMFQDVIGSTPLINQGLVLGNALVSGTPPTRSTAYLMDTDGNAFGASVVYQWMNEGLNKMARAVGGILDYSGVPTVAGQSMYTALGEWTEITDVWYGGYWVKGGKRMEYFRRNTVTSSILSRVTVSVFSDKQVLEVNYQPDRTSGVTSTTANMATTDTSVAISNPGVFLLPFGFAQIGTEIVAYASLASGQIAGLIRGLGSTVAQAWPSGTVVTELSLFWCGKRVTMNPYKPGDSAMNLAAPQGWVAILPKYMLAQAKSSELDNEEMRKLEDQFLKEALDWERANKPIPRFVQVSGSLGSGTTATFDNVLGNGVVIP